MRDGWCRRHTTRRLLLGTLAVAIGFGGVSHALAAAPVVPGYSVLTKTNAPEVDRGQLLLGELNCIACHKPAEGTTRVEAKGAPDLSKVGARLTPQFLTAYLADPHGIKPGATMPDVFHASDPEAKAGAVEFLTHYLVSLGGPIKPSETSGNEILVEQGRKLYETVGCVACHAPEKPLASEVVPSVPIGPQALKTTVEQLTEFLLDPLATRPHGRMPSSNLGNGEAKAIATYLLRDQLNNPQVADAAPARQAGLKFAYYENVHVDDASLEAFEKLKPKTEGIAPKPDVDVPNLKRIEDNFALKFSGYLKVPKEGKYEFTTTSDDGSRLYIDGKVVVNNDGVHAAQEKSGSVDLTAGDHEIAVTFYEVGNEQSLKVDWKGPDLAKSPIPTGAYSNVGGRPMVPLKSAPFTIDPQKAQMGERMFAMLGCANCHTAPAALGTRPAKALAELNVDAADGCIADQPKKGLPKYDVSADQKAALVAAIKGAGDLAKPFTPQERIVRTMAQMNCFACHSRDKVGGVGADRNDVFVMTAKFDMGDEGRIPPSLSGVGAKLLPKAIGEILFKGEHHIRRNRMATRMPRFAEKTAGTIVAAFEAADPAAEFKVPDFDQRIVKDGRTLVGNKGLGCVNCHGVGGVASLGMPSIDLSTVAGRLRPGWFHGLLMDPAKVTPGTRMPAFWFQGSVAFPNLGGGTADSQAGAIWTYLSLGKDMPLPPGLSPTGGSGFELVPIDEPIVHRTMMQDVGNRSVLVGYPEGLHVAFDADQVRLAKAWKGKFFDASGWWNDRGGNHVGPLGTDVITLPSGPSFAALASPTAPWPRPEGSNTRNLGGKFKGYTLDKTKTPTFKYDLSGVLIQEKDAPVLKAAGAALVRSFQLGGQTPPQGLTFLAAAGQKIEPGKEKGSWTIDEKSTVKLSPEIAADAVVRDAQNGVKQLVVPVKLNNGAAAFEVEMSW